MTAIKRPFRWILVLGCALSVLAGCKFDMPLTARSPRIAQIEAAKPGYGESGIPCGIQRSRAPLVPAFSASCASSMRLRSRPPA